jgi:hypothetical protein
VLVLLERVYEVHYSDGLREYDKHIKFHKVQSGVQKIVRGGRVIGTCLLTYMHARTHARTHKHTEQGE